MDHIPHVCLFFPNRLLLLAGTRISGRLVHHVHYVDVTASLESLDVEDLTHAAATPFRRLVSSTHAPTDVCVCASPISLLFSSHVITFSFSFVLRLFCSLSSAHNLRFVCLLPYILNFTYNSKMFNMYLHVYGMHRSLLPTLYPPGAGVRQR
jgi:hypothetical protein